MATISYSHVRENLAGIWNELEESRDEVILRRRGHEDMAILPADELRTLKESAHLLRSPRNAARLLTALARSREDGGLDMSSIEVLASEAGLNE